MLPICFRGKILEHQPERGRTYLAWGKQILQLTLHPEFSPGSRVYWLIPPGSVLLQPPPSSAPGANRENPVFGRIDELLTLRGLTTVIIRVADREQTRLILELPPHVVPA